ncbi:MAG: hypothetical protein KatS3mg065_0051 [Chloroflexota bacterium]|nr:MAG: hypothetical protein KatS3mg065_0051 [Chloroflexota bacterium]
MTPQGRRPTSSVRGQRCGGVVPAPAAAVTLSCRGERRHGEPFQRRHSSYANPPHRCRRGRLGRRPDRRPPRLLRADRRRRLRPGPGPAGRRPRRRPPLRRRPPARRRRRPGGARSAHPGDPGDPRPQRRRPPLRPADLRGRPRRRRRLPRHGDVALAAAPGATVRAARRQARRRAVRPGCRLGGGGPARPRRDRGRARPLRRLRPLRGRRALRRDRRDRGPGRGEPRRRGLRLRPLVLDLDDDRGVPEPAGRLGAGTGVGTRRRPSASPRRSSSPRGSGRSSA